MTVLLIVLAVMIAAGITLGVLAATYEHENKKRRNQQLMAWYESQARFHSAKTMNEAERLDRARREARAQREDMKRWHDA